MISKDDLSKISELAKLQLSEEESTRLTQELSQILGYVEKLDELDLKDVEATFHAVTVTNVFREDQALECKIKDKVFEQAPDSENHLFKVPRVI